MFLALVLMATTALSLAKDPEIYMDASQLITTKGYLFEEHSVTTQDGYILTIHRIPGKKNQMEIPNNRPVALILHGLLCDSTFWLVNLPHQNLPFLLADKGADVWIGNNRGTHYSKKHRTLSPTSEAFWDFSWDDVALYDLPAMLTYIRNLTSPDSRLYYVAHSQGTMVGFAGFPEMPVELASSVAKFYALAPVATVGYITSPVRYFSGHPEQLYKLLANLLCENILFVICGFDAANMNVSRIPVYISHTPSSTSVKNIVHFAQMVQSRRFQAYDYGSPSANMAHYNSTTPPEYKLGSYKQPPVVAFAGGSDWLADTHDVLSLISHLVKHDHDKPSRLVDLVTINEFDHLDFVWGTSSHRLVFDYIVNDIFSSIATSDGKNNNKIA